MKRVPAFCAAALAGASAIAIGLWVPTAYAGYRVDQVPRTPRSWGERMYDIARWQVMPAGGHFAAMEEPGAFVEDLRAFNKTL